MQYARHSKINVFSILKDDTIDKNANEINRYLTILGTSNVEQKANTEKVP